MLKSAGCLAGSVGRPTLVLGVMSPSPTLSIELTKKIKRKTYFKKVTFFRPWTTYKN